MYLALELKPKKNSKKNQMSKLENWASRFVRIK